MPPKPVIANPEFEYDSRTLSLADQAQVVTWVDSSPGGGNDATGGQGFVKYGAAGGPDQWANDIPGVIFDITPQADTFNFSGAWGVLSDITMFAVLECTDLSNGVAIIGSADGIDPPTSVYLLVYPDGSVHFIIGHDGVVAARDIGSSAGLVSSGDRILVSCRLNTSLGSMILRVKRTQVASFAGVEPGSNFWFSPKVRQCNLPSSGGFPGPVLGDDQNMPWVSGYSSAASDQEILSMEAFLFGVFFRTVWTPGPNPGTIWAPCN